MQPILLRLSRLAALALVVSVFAILGYEYVNTPVPDAPGDSDETELASVVFNPDVKLRNARDGEIEEILAQNVGKVVVIDVWATW